MLSDYNPCAMPRVVKFIVVSPQDQGHPGIGNGRAEAVEQSENVTTSAARLPDVGGLGIRNAENFADPSPMCKPQALNRQKLRAQPQALNFKHPKSQTMNSKQPQGPNTQALTRNKTGSTLSNFTSLAARTSKPHTSTSPSRETNNVKSKKTLGHQPQTTRGPERLQPQILHLKEPKPILVTFPMLKADHDAEA